MKYSKKYTKKRKTNRKNKKQQKSRRRNFRKMKGGAKNMGTYLCITTPEWVRLEVTGGEIHDEAGQSTGRFSPSKYCYIIKRDPANFPENVLPAWTSSLELLEPVISAHDAVNHDDYKEQVSYNADPSIQDPNVNVNPPHQINHPFNYISIGNDDDDFGYNGVWLPNTPTAWYIIRVEEGKPLVFVQRDDVDNWTIVKTYIDGECTRLINANPANQVQKNFVVVLPRAPLGPPPSASFNLPSASSGLPPPESPKLGSPPPGSPLSGLLPPPPSSSSQAPPGGEMSQEDADALAAELGNQPNPGL